MSSRSIPHRLLILASALWLAACSTLPPNPSTSLKTGWQVIRQDARLDVQVRAHQPVSSLSQPKLGRVSADASGLSDDDQTELEKIRASLEQSLRQNLAAQATQQPSLNIRLRDAAPASTALNIASALLVILPLDTGAITVEAELLAPDGQRITLWRERVNGGMLDLGESFSRWGRIRNALEAWAQRCVQRPEWRPTATALAP
ncbi:DUF3313 family protein [Uliginosibacterium gangwonense]|uniref:DUF3313 family protein n=1 Tax=Uliginosibacterium gangwonense TaxID=392736 RepID=UPI000366506A|nr:DUF3313 family protein [Uliginosibacterium gangwonense]